jgi:hypothetical protein
MPPLMRALKALPPPPMVTPGIMFATDTEGPGAPETTRGKLCSVSGAMLPLIVGSD